MKLKDVVEIIRCDIPDLTEGPFDVAIESDDGGSHVVVRIEDHEDGKKILDHLTTEYSGTRALVMLVPEDWIKIHNNFNK